MLFLRRFGAVAFLAAVSVMASQAATLQMAPLPAPDAPVWQTQSKPPVKKGECYKTCSAKCKGGGICLGTCSKRCGGRT